MRSVPSLRIGALLLLALGRHVAADVVLSPDPARTIGKPLDLRGFVDERGTTFEAIRAADVGPGVPWVVSPIYTRCRSTCSPLTAVLKRALAEADPRSYRVVSFSFDRDERADALLAFRAHMQLPEAWLTLRTTDATVLDRTLTALDFRTIALGDGQLDHPNLVAILTPDMRLSEYVFGLDFTARDVAAALDRARAGGAGRRRWHSLLFVVAALGFTGSAFVFASRLVRRRQRRR